MNYRYGVYKVFLLNGNRVSEHQIRPAGQTEDQRGKRFEVAEGLKPGDRVAVAISGRFARWRNRPRTIRREYSGVEVSFDGAQFNTPMKLAETCVKYPVFTVMLIAFLVTLGAFSYRGLAVDLFPKADPATVNVEVQLPGATPEEVVTGVVLPLEDAISSVSGIDEISVYSSEGFADITCTFVLERDIDGAAQDIREKVAAAINRLPRDTLPPVITKQDPQSDPILTLLVSGPISRRELTEIADKQIRRAIQTVDGVGSVEFNGGQARQIRVLLDAQKLTAHNFTVLDVRDALQRENIEAPGGRMITGPQELGLRTLGRVTSAEQFGDIVVGTRGGAQVRVRDVAQVEDGAQELRTWSALFRKGTPGPGRRQHPGAAPVGHQHRAGRGQRQGQAR